MRIEKNIMTPYQSNTDYMDEFIIDSIGFIGP